MTIGAALTQAMEVARWTPAKLAAEAGVTETTARRWLSGSNPPPGDALLKLQRALPALNDLLATVKLDGAA